MTDELVIGLEIHVELATNSKIFCGCSTAFGAPPNSQVCPVCSGMPGTLPVLNKSVIELAMRAGLALGCSINQTTVFDRKNYFYPDLPKAYQISQLYQPICINGELIIAAGDTLTPIRIREIHLEEDAGKLIHDPETDQTLIDYNRCGVPLIEIVTQPDFRSSEQVLSFLEQLREVLMYLGVSDCKLQEGSMRVDVNLSVRPDDDSEFGVRTEIKNLNSFKTIEAAIAAEYYRQQGVLSSGGTIIQQTRRWDDEQQQTVVMRSKEDAQDYRYFPDPDLLTIKISDAWLNEVRHNLPPSADYYRQHFINTLGLSAYDAQVLTADKAVCDLFVAATQLSPHAKEIANQITGEVLRLLKTARIQPSDISPQHLSTLAELTVTGKINRNVAKQVLAAVVVEQVEPGAYVQAQGLLMLNDDSKLATVVATVIADNANSVADYYAGKEKALGFLIGKAMQALEGKANPQLIRDLILKRLQKPSE